MAEKKISVSVQQLVVGALVLAVVAGAFWVGKLTTELKLLKSGGAAQLPETQQPKVAGVTKVSNDEWQKLLESPAVTRGNSQAKVTMVEFVDYQCPFCKRAFDETWPVIMKDYVDSGKMFYVIRDLPLAIHANAPVAAQAVRCAGDGGKYWEMHDKVFETQEEWSSGGKVDELMKQYARQVGVEGKEFDSCYDEEKYKKVVEGDAGLANNVGVTGTPTFIINGTMLVGAQPIEAFKKVIDGELSK